MSEHFDNHIVLDPSAVRTDRVTPFPRPLRGVSRPGHLRSRDIPIVGSYGMGTPGKGFEHLIQAVNREFDRAIVRINVAPSTYADATMASVHRQPYAAYLEELCRRVAKPGIEIEFSRLFMGDDELIDWCGQNDLNSFFYTRRQSGLSATTDQCILSGRPLVVSTNDTFRHIHRYIPPYPLLSLKQALGESKPLVARMQVDWSSRRFCEVFADMLERARRAGERKTGVDALVDRFAASTDPGVILVVVEPSTALGDAYSYVQRAIDALGRTGDFRTIAIQADRAEAEDLEGLVFWAKPTAIMLVGSSDRLAGAIGDYAGPVLHLEVSYEHRDRPEGYVERGVAERRMHVFERRPIVPYFTALPSVPAGPPRISMVGFLGLSAAFQRAVAKIQREQPDAIITVLGDLATDQSDRELFETSLGDLQPQLALTPGLQIHLADLPRNANEIIHWFGSNDLNMFAGNPYRIDEIVNLCELALTTERATIFTRAAPFRQFEQGTFLEDHSISSLIRRKSACQINLYNLFSEGAFYRDVCSALGISHFGGATSNERSDPALPAHDASMAVPAANGIVDERAGQWLERRCQARLSSKPGKDKLEAVRAQYYRPQQHFLLTAVERLCSWSRSSRILCLGDGSRACPVGLQTLGYDVQTWDGGAAPGGVFDVIFSSTALPDMDDARVLLASVAGSLRPGGGGAFTFFTRDEYAAGDDRENPDFTTIDPAQLRALVGELGLSLVGTTDWQIGRPMLRPNPFEAPSLATLTFVKPADRSGEP